MSDQPRDPHLPGGTPPPPASGPITPPPGATPATPVPEPKQKKSALLVTVLVIGGIIAVIVIAGVVLAVVFFANAGTYEANGVSFEYPKTWTEATDLTTGTQAGGASESGPTASSRSRMSTTTPSHRTSSWSPRTSCRPR